MDLEVRLGRGMHEQRKNLCGTRMCVGDWHENGQFTSVSVPSLPFSPSS